MIYDISPAITENLAVWPGDTPPSREILSDMKRGADLTLSTLHATGHLGAHADAPSHNGRDAPTIDQQPLDLYVGPCEVVSIAVPRATVITPDAFKADITAERILLRTGTFPDPNDFNEDFAALSPALVDMLADKGTRLIGVDTPSVDPFHSKDLPAHQACLRHDLAILEGLVLADVPDGAYELIALPLRLVGFDASPVRAVLRTLNGAT